MRRILSSAMSLAAAWAICSFGMTAQLVEAACPEISFTTPTYFASGLNTNSLATGDINEDGKADVVAANDGSGTLTLRFGDGAGGFPASSHLSVTTPSAVVLADFNGDGHLDLATTSRSIGRLGIRLGSGDGTFGSATETSVGSGASGIAMGDFNSDGQIDLVTSNGATNTISFLPGNGTGSFPTATNFSIARGSGAFGIVAADFNGDGRLDVATANRGTANISVLFGNGAGSFAPAVVYPAGTQPNNIATADLNADGKPDLMTANFGSGNITVRTNDGLGNFPATFNLPMGVQPLHVATGDFDDDGNVDIVGTNQGGHTLSVFRGNGNGTFAPRKDFALNAGSRALLVADLDRDDLLDIAAGVDSSAVAILLNGCSTNTPPTIAASVVVREQDAAPSNAVVASVGDEQDDPAGLAVAVNGAASATENGVTVSGIVVNANGNVTADVRASCGASDSTFTLTVTDSEGLSATAMLTVDVLNETAPPIINNGSPIPDISIYLPLNSSDVSVPITFDLPVVADNCTATPTVTASPESGSTFNAGSTLVTVTARDAPNNTATTSFRVNVLFSFGGFMRPIDPFPMLNIATGGSSIPVKFSLSGNRGLNILAPGYPATAGTPCNENEPGSTVEETTAGGEGLTYDEASDQYIYIWKTSKDWKGSCRILILKLADGSEQYAKFRFR